MIRKTEIYSHLSNSWLICVLWLCCCSTTVLTHQSDRGSFLWAIWHVILYYFLDNVEIDLKSLEWHHGSCLIQLSVNFNAYKDLRHLILWCWCSHDVWLWRLLRTLPCFAWMPQVRITDICWRIDFAALQICQLTAFEAIRRGQMDVADAKSLCSRTRVKDNDS